jgi:hypothetical protein
MNNPVLFSFVFFRFLLVSSLLSVQYECAEASISVGDFVWIVEDDKADKVSE